MAEQRTAIDAATGKGVAITPEMTKTEMRALAVEVLDRGIVSSRLHVPLPDGVHGEWVRNDTESIHEMITKGFKIDDEYATKRPMHEGDKTKAVVGDVIFMTCPKAWKETLDEVRQERYNAMHAPRKQQAEEKEFNSAARTLEKHGIGVTIDSSAEVVSGDDIKAAKAAAHSDS